MTGPRAITIIGGHGKVGLLLAPLLTAHGHTVQSTVRNRAHADEVAATGAEPVLADVEHLSTAELERLLAGQDAVVWSAGAGGGDPARTVAVDRDAAIRAIDAAVAAGVPRFVTVSFSGARADRVPPPDHPFHTYAQAKVDADEHLRAAPIAWTIVAPGALTDDPASARVNPDPEPGDGDEAPRELVAQVIHAALDSPASERRTLAFGAGDVPLADWIPPA